jgi:hypothetical protein
MEVVSVLPTATSLLNVKRILSLEAWLVVFPVLSKNIDNNCLLQAPRRADRFGRHSLIEVA